MEDVVETDAFATVLCDPPHDMKEVWYECLFRELARVSRRRIIFQHWFIPSNQDGSFKGDSSFKLTNILTWHPGSIHDQALVVSVFDK